MNSRYESFSVDQLLRSLLFERGDLAPATIDEMRHELGRRPEELGELLTTHVERTGTVLSRCVGIDGCRRSGAAPDSFAADLLLTDRGLGIIPLGLEEEVGTALGLLIASLHSPYVVDASALDEPVESPPLSMVAELVPAVFYNVAAEIEGLVSRPEELGIRSRVDPDWFVPVPAGGLPAIADWASDVGVSLTTE